MLPPFGFSVGDFVSGINLVRDLIKALEDSAGSSAEYRDLIKELYSLERALLEVKHLDLDESQHTQGVALQQAAIQCQQAIDAFLQKIRKFQPALRTGGSNSWWRDGLRKIEWALYKKEDVQQFRAQLHGHTASINILLTTLQLQTSTIQSRRLNQQRDTGNSKHRNALTNSSIETNRQLLNSHTDLILTLTKIASNAATQEHSQDLKDLMLKVLKTNLQIYDMVVDMQANLPQQIERQQPVMFLDACGRLSPIHLEFISSAQAFLAVLKIRFQDAGLRKIERGQFTLEEARTKRTVDLGRPWHTCFLPGQKIDMSMVFSQPETPKSTCPGCQYETDGKTAEDIECSNCGIHYRRIVENNEETPLHMPPSEARDDEARSSEVQASRKRKFPKSFQESRTNHRDNLEESESEADDVHLFRRVHIKARRAKNIEKWSALDKHNLLAFYDGGREISLVKDIVWPADKKRFSVIADESFDRNSGYYEITVLPGEDPIQHSVYVKWSEYGIVYFG